MEQTKTPTARYKLYKYSKGWGISDSDTFSWAFVFRTKAEAVAKLAELTK